MKGHCAAFERSFSFETSSVQRPPSCCLSGGSPDVQPNGSDMDTGVEEERAAAADLAVWPVIYNDVSTNPLSLKLSDPEQGM